MPCDNASFPTLRIWSCERIRTLYAADGGRTVFAAPSRLRQPSSVDAGLPILDDAKTARPDVGSDDDDNDNNKGEDSPSGATNGMTSLLFCNK